MSDNNSIATLKDYQSSIEASFRKIDKKLDDFDGIESSSQLVYISSMNSEISNVKNNISLMRMEISNLEEEKNQNEWQGIISDIQKRNSEYKDKVVQKEKSKKNSGAGGSDFDDIDAKIDHSKMTTQQAFDRGDKILSADRAAISRMKNMVSGDLQTMKDVNAELDRQGAALENADKDLTEIDYSLKRAGEQMKSMLKMYATDKFIMCMIFVIALVIVAVVIVSFIKGGDDDGDDSGPLDIF